MRFLVFVFLSVSFFILPSCSDDDPAPVATDRPQATPTPAPTPGPTSDNNDWQRVRNRWEAHVECGCEEGTFTVTESGRWAIGGCGENESGELTSTEREGLNGMVQAVVKATNNTSLKCDDNEFPNYSASTSITLDNGNTRTVYSIGESGECFRGNPNSVSPLMDYMETLEAKYGFPQAEECVAEGN